MGHHVSDFLSAVSDVYRTLVVRMFRINRSIGAVVDLIEGFIFGGFLRRSFLEFFRNKVVHCAVLN